MTGRFEVITPSPGRRGPIRLRTLGGHDLGPTQPAVAMPPVELGETGVEYSGQVVTGVLLNGAQRKEVRNLLLRLKAIAKRKTRTTKAAPQNLGPLNNGLIVPAAGAHGEVGQVQDAAPVQDQPSEQVAA